MNKYLLNPDNFIFVEYNGIHYPSNYVPQITEIAGHFDKQDIDYAESYSIHTEYSFTKRKLTSTLIDKYPVLKEAHKNNVPQLWKSNEWALSFAEFLIVLTGKNPPPKIIEIHPPFNDYCTLDEFIERYSIFESKIHSTYPDTLIVLENRSGARYKGGKFLIEKSKEIAELCNKIKEKNIKLYVVIDFPQLLTAEKIDPSAFSTEKYYEAIENIIPHQDLVKGIHIWGKKRSSKGRWVAHAGNLDTYFSNDTNAKNHFINGINQICNDGKQRFLVPEVNTGFDDLLKIITDLFTTDI